MYRVLPLRAAIKDLPAGGEIRAFDRVVGDELVVLDLRVVQYL